MFLPGRVNPVVLRRNSTALFLLQRVRDEAHRFAITYHRQLRRRERLRSVLDSIPGVGAARRQRLLRHFGSVRRMRDATVTALAEVPGTSPARAEEIKSALEGLASAAETDRASVQASTAPGDPANRDDNRAHRLRARRWRTAGYWPQWLCALSGPLSAGKSTRPRKLESGFCS